MSGMRLAHEWDEAGVMSGMRRGSSAGEDGAHEWAEARCEKRKSTGGAVSEECLMRSSWTCLAQETARCAKTCHDARTGDLLSE